MRVYNFAPGPACLPLEVLEKVKKDLPEYPGEGMTVMEMSHRSKVFEGIKNKAEQNLRKLMNIPENYHVLFLQGGASLQFAMVPLNLSSENGVADYVNTGMWTQKAISEAKKFTKVNLVASSESSVFNYIPELDANTFTKNADYFYIATNNTIYGTRYDKLPETKNVPLIADMSSDILSKVYDVSKFGIIFAGAQKNIGPAGVTVVIIRNDLVKPTPVNVPSLLQYAIHVENESLYNTPPSFSIYVSGLMFEWLTAFGGVAEIQKQNEYQAKLMYDYLDESKLFSSTVKGKHRSIMNIPFVTGNKDIDAEFIREAEKKGLTNLGGHRTVGGMRASIYNAMPTEGVQALVNFMKEFETSHK